MGNEELFEVLPADEMREKYGLYADRAEPRTLDPENVPPMLRSLIPMAELWGISDDLIRADFIAGAPEAAKGELKASIERFDDSLDDWLAGPEAEGPDFSEEYIAFTCMRMAADEV